MAEPTISQLLCSQKRVVLPERIIPKTNPSHSAWELTLEADCPGEFAAYFRVNIRLPESFSVGLRYRPDRGASNVLLRINGDHGVHRNPDGFEMDGAHVHMPTSEQLWGGLPGSAWAPGPPYAAPLGVSFLTLSQAWELLATGANIENTADVRTVISKLQGKIASGQLSLLPPQ